jgi:soluble lytic murein transglycosylase-like protein
MVRLTHLSGSLSGTASTSPNALIRIGRGPDCDVRFDSHLDSRVSAHHAEIRFEDGHYVVIDVGSSNGTLLNGKRVRRQKLRPGDRIVFGAQDGPEVRFDIDDSHPGLNLGGQRAPAQAAPQRRPAAQLAPDQDAQALAQEAQQKIAMARAMSGAESSGQTMFIMADSLQRAERTAERKIGKRWKKVVLAVLAVACAGFVGMGVYIWRQSEEIGRLGEKKASADKEIQRIQLQMQIEGDPEKLQALEERLLALTGKAQQAIGEMQQKDKAKAAEMTTASDELDRQLRQILRKFDAETYAIPPIFKERVRHHIEGTLGRGNTRSVVYKRKKQFWPVIVKELSALGLPEEMGYVAWVESQFDAYAESSAHAKGMWQFMPDSARRLGLRVDDKLDERTDVVKSTRAAARYLAQLLAQFGGDSFMLAIAAYNKGENGLMRVLRDGALEPGGWRKEKRDFWHLYRMHKLPEETMEYVPQILAAAVISNNPQRYGLE